MFGVLCNTCRSLWCTACDSCTDKNCVGHINDGCKFCKDE